MSNADPPPPPHHDEERVCRVCRCGEEAGVLFHPCRCRGTIKFVHQRCLERWLAHSRSRHCEVCRMAIRFRPVVEPTAPSPLLVKTLVAALVESLVPKLRLLPLLCECALGWGVLVPLLSGVVWEGCAGWRVDVFHDPSAWVVARTIGEGLVACGVIVLAPAIVTTLVDAIAALPPLVDPHHPEHHHRHDDEDDDDDDDDEGSAESTDSEGELDVPDEDNALEDEEEDDDDEEEEEREGDDDGEAGREGELEEWAEEEEEEGDEEEGEEEEEDNDDEWENEEGEEGWEERFGEEGNAGPLDQEADWAPVVGAMEARLRQIPAIAGILLLTNMVCLPLLVFLPMQLGRAFAKLRSVPSPSGIRQLVLGYGILLLAVLCVALCVAVLCSVTAISSRAPVTVARAKAALQQFVFAGVVAKVVALFAVEFLFFPLLCGSLLHHASFIALTQTNPLASLGASATWGERLAALYVPTAGPWGVCTQWASGIAYMVLMGVFIHVMREFVQGYVLFFLRDPDDPNFHPLRIMVEGSWATQLRRIAFTMAYYVLFVGVSVALPLAGGMLIAPSLFGLLRTPVMAPFQNPAYAIAIGTLIPEAIHRLRLRATFRRFFEIVLPPLAAPLQLSRFLIKPSKLGPLGLWHAPTFNDVLVVRREAVGGVFALRGVPPFDGRGHTQPPREGVTPPHVRTRMVAFTVAFCAALALALFVLLLLPLALGHLVSLVVGKAIVGDARAEVGVVLFILLADGVLGVVRHVRVQHETVATSTATLALAFTRDLLKGAVALALVFGPLTLAIGQFLQMVTTTVLYGSSVTARLDPPLCWASGLCFLMSLWITRSFHAPLLRFFEHGAHVIEWQREVNGMVRVGFLTLGLGHFVKRVFLPLATQVALLLCAPHLASHVVVPLLVSPDMALSFGHTHRALTMLWLVFWLELRTEPLLRLMRDWLITRPEVAAQQLQNFEESE